MSTTSAQVEQAPQVGLRAIFRRFWPETRPFRVRMVLSLLLVPVAPLLGTASIYLFKVLVDNVLTPHDYRQFPPIAAAYLGITVLSGLVSFVDEYLSAWVGERFVLTLRVRLFDHLQRLSLGYFESHQLGDVLSRLTGDVGSIEQLVLTGINMALTYGFQVVLFAGAMLYLNWQLALASFVAAPAFLLLARSFSRRIQSASRVQRQRSGSISAVAEESLGNVALVQAYDRSDDEVARFGEENEGSFRAQMRATRLESLFGPFSSLLEAIGVLVVMGIAVYELAQNRITLGGLLAFLTYLGQLYGPIQGFGGLSNTIYAASASAERIIEVLDEEPAVVEAEQPRPLGRAAGAIGIEDVGFTYPGSDGPALRGLRLRIAPGRTVAVVGASGAGKSTLTKLLLRSYDPDRGRITLDGRDLRDLSLSDLRRNVTAVLQETLVFDGTVAENIRWGKPDATDAEVVAAAVAADAHQFVMGLDDGYDTRVGQRGRMLSGGQRQRLAIARAMIRNSPVLLLDEPTTGLDAESSRRVLAPLRRLMSGRTTLVISHNLLTVTDADEIVFLADGRITATGTHDELLRRSPGYAELYRLHHPGDSPAPLSEPPTARLLRDHLSGAPRPVRPAPAPTPAPLAVSITTPVPRVTPKRPWAQRPVRPPTPRPQPVAGPGPTTRPVPAPRAVPARTDEVHSPRTVPAPQSRPAAAPRPAVSPQPAAAPRPAVTSRPA
ncbi:MAG: ATP-binding cassette, subfamily bacterial, partial [Pseudonocardiales bacterium]|nr:ATP-binding cassette, subfamily bacterial [Pseudonocardiales bacterium]